MIKLGLWKYRLKASSKFLSSYNPLCFGISIFKNSLKQIYEYKWGKNTYTYVQGYSPKHYL